MRPTRTDPTETGLNNRLLTRLKRDWESAESVRDNMMSQITDWRSQYNSEFHELGSDREQRSLYVPKTYQYVQRLVAEMLQVFFGEEDQFAKIAPRLPRGTDPMAADMMEKLFMLYWGTMKPYTPLYGSFIASARDSTGALKLTWDKMTQNGRVLTNKPRLNYIPIEYVLWDPTAKYLDDIRYVIHEKQVSLGYLWQKQAENVYENVDRVSAEASDKETRTRPSRFSRSYANQPADPERQLVTIREYWGQLQLLPDTELYKLREQGKNAPAQDVVCTTFEDKVMLRPPEPNPYAKIRKDPTPYEKLPFFLGHCILKDAETWGRSVVGELEALQEEINKVRNQRRQNVDLAMCTKAIADTNLDIDKDALTDPTFTGIVDSNGNPNDGVMLFKPGNVTQGMEREEAIVDGDMQRVSGVTNPKLGVSARGRQTASEVMSLLEQSNQNIAMIPQNLMKTQIVPMCEFLCDCIVAFVEPPEVAEQLGFRVPPPPLSQILDREWDITVKAGMQATSKTLQVKNLQFALQIIQPMAQFAPQVYMPIYMSLTEKLLPLLDVDSAAQLMHRAKQMQRRQPPQPQQRQVSGGQRQTRQTQTAARRGPSQEEMAGVG